MDEFWGVVWGASIALVASVVGGALTALVGPALARRAEASSKEVASEQERWETIRQAIQDASVLMRRASMAWEMGEKRKAEMILEEVDVVAITLRLRTTHEERSIARALSHASAEEDARSLIIHSVAWERAAADWYRGAVSTEDFDAACERERSLANERMVKAVQATDGDPSLA